MNTYQNFKTHYKAASELTIDDSMIGTKCILHYLLKKPTNGEVQVCVHAAAAQHSCTSIYIGLRRSPLDRNVGKGRVV